MLASVPASAEATTPEVRLSGEVVQVADQDGLGFAAIRLSDGGLVPVTPESVKDIVTGSSVILDVVIPPDVRLAAAANRVLTTRGADGDETSVPLHPSDLAAASDGSPESLTSAVGRATVARALAPGTPPLEVSRVVTAAADPVSSFTPAIRQVYVAVVTPAGTTAAPAVNESRIRAQVTGASSYWSDVTGGDLTLRVATIGARYTSAFTCSNPFGLWNEAAGKVGFTFAPNTSLLIELPPGISSNPASPCGYGLGTVGQSPNDWGLLYTADDVWPVLAHELGHNMSLQHADALLCPTAADSGYSATTGWTGTGCTQDSYGDGQDVMSASSRDFAPFLSTPQLLRTGMIPPSAATVIDTVGTRSVTLLPLAGRTGVRTAEVINPSTGVTYYVEYRTWAGRDLFNTFGVNTGVRVLRYNPATGSTVLLDPSPSGRSHDSDPTLPVGKTFISYDGSLSITTLSANIANAVVSITNAPPVTAPTLTGKPASVTRGTAALFTFAGPHSSDATASLTYRCSLDDAAYSACGSPKSYSSLPSALHSFAVKAVDPSGYSSIAVRHTWRVDALAPVLTLSAPKAAFTLASGLVPAWTAKDTGSGVANVDVRWQRAAYNRGFEGWVYPSGWQKMTVTKTTLAAAVRGYTYCFSARARDKAGNTSAWSGVRCSAVALDDRSLAASSGWSRSTGTGFYGGSAMVTTRSSVTLTRTGVQTKRITLVATRCAKCGTVGIYWNGAMVKKVSLYAATTHRRSILTAAMFTRLRSGTVSVRTLTSGKAIQVDGLGLSRW
jgi:hypothetical protein